MNYISVIGAGSWGTALANHLGDKGLDVMLWAREKEVVDEIAGHGMNSLYLPGVGLSENIVPVNDLKEAAAKARYLVIVVPTQFVRSVFNELAAYIRKEAVIVSAAKGIERESLKPVTEIIEEYTGNDVSVLSGPSFAHEVAAKKPTAVTLAVQERSTGIILQEIFNTNYFRVYTHDDILGVELSGALKNVIAIAAGISDGLDLGLNARAALITRGLSEIMRLGVKMGAKEMTFTGLSGMGDLVLTCTGRLSRNYSTGVRLGKGEKLDDILSSMKSVVEGIATADSAYKLSKSHSVEMPIVEQVYEVIHNGKDPETAVIELMSRNLKQEFEI